MLDRLPNATAPELGRGGKRTSYVGARIGNRGASTRRVDLHRHDQQREPGGLRVKEAVPTIADAGSAIAALTVLDTRSETRRKTRTLSAGSRRAPTAALERGSPAWHRPLEEGAVVDAALDDGVRGARHLRGDGRERLAPEIGIVPIPGDVSLEFAPEALSR